MSCLFSCLRFSSSATGAKASAEKYVLPPSSSPEETLRTLMPHFIQSVVETTTTVHTTVKTTTTYRPILKYKPPVAKPAATIEHIASAAALPPAQDSKYDPTKKFFVVDETSPVVRGARQQGHYIIDEAAAALNAPLPIETKTNK